MCSGTKVFLCTNDKGTMENERIQTLNWLESVPRNKLNTKKMVMVISSASGFVPKFVPMHLLGEKISTVYKYQSSNIHYSKTGLPLPRKS